METNKDFLKILDENRLKFTHEKVKKNFSNWNRSVLYHFTDLDSYWHFHLINGEPTTLNQGHLENPDIVYEMSTNTFIAINNKEISGMKAYNQKLVKVKAKMPDLLKLQKIDKI